jgi:hypothetical protein
MADYEGFKNFTAAIQSIATIISFGIGGYWVFRKYVREVDNYPHIESDADIRFIGEKDNFWIVELIGLLETKGK